MRNIKGNRLISIKNFSAWSEGDSVSEAKKKDCECEDCECEDCKCDKKCEVGKCKCVCEKTDESVTNESKSCGCTECKCSKKL